jgi:hypothetical protein
MSIEIMIWFLTIKNFRAFLHDPMVRPDDFTFACIDKDLPEA